MEVWKDIEGYDGLYQISNLGRVKSFKQGRTKILKPQNTRKGYLLVALSKSNQKKWFSVHRLVAAAFIPNPECKPQVNHINGDKADNRVENLEWVTNAENIQHAFDTGLEVAPQGEERTSAKLTNEQARFIRDNPDKLNTVELAKKFGVTAATVSTIQLGKKYRTAGGKIRKANKRTPRLPNNIREQIRAEYIYHSSEFGCYALGKKYGVNPKTIHKIVHEK